MKHLKMWSDIVCSIVRNCIVLIAMQFRFFDIYFFLFLYSVGVKEYIFLKVLQK